MAMELRKKIYSLIELVLLVFSVVLQATALVLPGWRIVSSEEKTTYYGVYYVVECNQTDCGTTSWQNMYHKLLQESKDEIDTIVNGRHSP